MRTGYVTIAAIFGTLVAWTQLNGGEPLSPADCASMMQYVRNNYSSVNSYDVLLKYERQEDGEDESITFTRACRVACSPEHNRLAGISIKEEVDNIRNRRRVRSLSFLVDNGSILQTEFLSEPTKLPARSFDVHLQDASIANICLIPASFFPNASYTKERMDDRWDLTIGGIASYGKVVVKGHRIEVEVEFPFRPGKFGEYSSRLKYVFDARTSLPTSWSCTYLSKSDQLVRETLRYQSSIEWDEPAPGIFLPTSLLIRAAGVRRDGKNGFVPTREVTNVEIEWISVNAKIDPAIWDADALMDYETAQSLCKFPLSSPASENKRP